MLRKNVQIAARDLGGARALAAPSSAQIVTDGTLGPAGALTGPAFVIDERSARGPARNLFHSFSELQRARRRKRDVHEPTSPATTNVISRVTGTGRFA